jgi:cytoskeletal protein CcmA (bactofilin family)
LPVLFRRKNGAPPDLPPVPPAGLPVGPAATAARDDSRLPGGGHTIIGGHTRIQGTLSGAGSIVVHGAVEGAIAIGGVLSIGPGGRVEADVEAQNVSVEGEARGSIRAGARVALGATGLFEGRIATPILDLSPGSVLRGSARIAGVPVRDRRGLSH